jgi:molybdopterin/thiamine biosynthesis adenylyltransferase
MCGAESDRPGRPDTCCICGHVPAEVLDRTRFDRQLGVEGIGTAGQERLRQATVVVAGVGGVGGAAATYLAAAGVGRLELVHPGTLELPDLNRQTLMTPDTLGEPRVYTAAATLRRHFPDVEVVAHDTGIDDAAVPGLVAGADVVVDARHNFPERYLLNRLCRERGVPSVVAAMDGTGLQLLTCEPGSACWRCVFPQPDPEWEPLGFRVLGAVAGTAGCLAAAEAVKLLTGAGSVLRGRLLVADLWAMSFQPVPVRPAPGCPDCAAAPVQLPDDAAVAG